MSAAFAGLTKCSRRSLSFGNFTIMLSLHHLFPRKKARSGFSHSVGRVCLILLASTVQWARADVQLLALAGDWRYQQTTNLDGVNWQAAVYDDSNWPTGKALLYVESNSLVSPRNTPLTLGATTYYFRTHFAFPFERTNLLVTFSSRIDDGAVFYLNGQEIQRIRMAIAPIPISYTNLATTTPPGGDATSSDTFVLSGAALSNLLTGDNVLAVEVHQNATNSDDIVFGTAVTVTFTNSPPIVVQQPTDVSVLDGRAATLSAIIDGNPSPALQWIKDSLPVPGATNSWLAFAAAYPTNEGTYWLAATNSFGGLTTSNALLRVLADTNPPVIVSALASKNLTNITVTFSEAVLSATATNPNNFEVFQTRLPSSHLDVASVSLSGSAGVVLKTTARTPGLNYSLRVNGIRDSSSASNQIAPNSELDMSYQVDLVAVDAQTTWRYLQGGFDPGTNWVRPDFDASTWAQGAAVFAGGSPTPSGPDPVRTALSLTAASNVVVTYYFRTFFDLPGPMITNSLRMHDIADDGAIFYLNGSEVFSVGMPTTRPVTYSTSASRTVGTAAYEPSLSSAGWSLSASNLAALNNCLATELHQRTNSMADTAFAANLEAVISHCKPRPLISIPASVLEGVGTLTNQGQVTILEPVDTNLVLQLSSSRPADVSMPDTVTVPAGVTNVGFDLVIGDDTLVNGPRAVTVRVGGADVVPATATIQVLDNETNTISISIASSTVETNGTLSGEVRFAQAAVTNITVTLASSDVTALKVPPSVMMPAGMTSAVFQASVVDDALIDGPQTVTLSAAVAGWPTGSANVVVDDNEPKTVTVILPANVVEGAGTLVSVGKVQLAGIAVSNLTVALSSSLPGLVSVASNITVNAGQSNASFDLTLVDNAIYEPSRVVVISAAIAGFTPGSNMVTVLDDDAHHFGFSTISSPQVTTTPFNLTVTAMNSDGTVVTNFRQSVTLLASSLNGILPVEPAIIGPFISGRWSGSIRVTAPGKLVRLSCALAPGESYPFHVVPPPFRKLALAADDLACDPVSGAVLATVSSAGDFQDQLLAIDPTTATITNAYNVGSTPGQMEISPSGQSLYVSLSNNYALRRFDLVTHSMGSIISYGASTDGPLRATDFAVVGGMADSVVVALASLQYYGSVRRYDSGVPAPISLGGQIYPTLLTCSPTSPVVYALDSSFAVLGRFSVNPVGSVVVTNGSITGAGRHFAYNQGVLYAESGEAVAADTFTLLGKYATAGPVVVDQPTRRALFVDYPNYFNCRIKVYDRDSFNFINSMLLPSVAGVPIRLIRWGTNGLAFNTAYGEVWFVQSDLVVPTEPPADLVLTGNAPAQPVVVGSNATYSLTLSNRGPGMATLIRLSNSLPAAVTLVATTASTGLVSQAAGSLVWDIPDLVSGASATLQFSVVHSNPGWHYSVASAAAYEPDFVLTNNTVTLTTYVQPAPNNSGPLAFALSTEDLLFDPAQDRILLSQGNTGNAQSNGIAIFNPYTGLIDSFTPLGHRPAKIERSSGGEFLYVSLKDDALVRQLALPALTSNLEFALGGEYIYGLWYPFYAADLATVPGAPGSVVAWRVRRAGPMAGEYGWGIGVFDNGVMRPAVTDSGGSWKVEFDTDSGTLLGFNNGDLRRCSLDSNGVSFVESYPPFYSAGDDLEYAGGRLFTTTGREVRYQPFQVMWVFAGAEGASLVEPDAGSGRVFYLTQDNGWRIKAYDMESKVLLGSVAVSNVVGTPTSLIRWGTNGLAFRTTGDQVFIVRTPLAQPESAADLAIQIEGPDAPVAVGSEAIFVLSVTNRGPQPALGVTVTNSFSPSVTIGWTSCTEGSIQATNGRIVWSLPGLNAGQGSFATVGIRSMQTGLVTVAADVISSTLDARRSDNSAMSMLQVGKSFGGADVLVLPFPARDLVWSPTLGRILLIANTQLPNWAGSLLSLDPATLAIGVECDLSPGAGKLALAGDASKLYASVDYAIQAIDMPQLTRGERFPLDPLGDLAQAVDLKVQPGNASVVAVAGSYGSIAAYENGVRRMNTVSLGANSIAFNSSGDRLFGLRSGVFYGGYMEITKLGLDSSGVSSLQTLPGFGPWGTGAEIKFAEGRLYTAPGYVLDPEALAVLGAFSSMPAGSLLQPDLSIGRVFFLLPEGGSWTLAAYDAQSYQRIGSLSVPGVSGTPSSLIRWGLDGFAFRTSGNQLFMIHTSLVPTNPPADLLLGITMSPGPYVAGSNITHTIAVSNAGPNTAVAVVWSNTLPAGTVVVNVTASLGSFSIASNIISGRLLTLATNEVATITVTYVVPAAGMVTNQALGLSSSVDPTFANNSYSRLLWIQPPGGGLATASLSLPVKDLERDPIRRLLYASFGSGAGPLADSIVMIDPANGDISGPVRVGSDPGCLAASPDGQFLYVALDSAFTVQKLALPSLTLITSFAVPQNQTVVRMVVCPTNSDMVAIRRAPPGKTSLHVAGVERPNELSSQDLFAFLDTTGQLFGCDGFHSDVKLYELDTGPNGLGLLAGQPGKQSSANDLKSSGGLLFFDHGMVLNPDTTRVHAVMPVPYNSVVEPDASSGRVFYLTPSGSVWTLRAFDIGQGIEVGTVPLPALTGTPRRLLRWGADGLAFYIPNSQVVILRGQLVPTNPPVDVVLNQSFSTSTATTNDALNVSLQLTNLGPVTASGVVVTQTFSLPITNVNFTASLGTASFTNGTATWQLGSLPTGAVASLTVTLRALQPGTLTASAAAYHDLNDVSWGNNTALGAVNILNPAASNILQIRLASRELVYDSARDVIYASTPASNGLGGNLIAVIDPATGEMKRTLAAGSEPDQLALSDDARFLYASLNGTMGARRIDLLAPLTEYEFPFSFSNIFNAFDLEVQPGHPETFAVSRVDITTSGDYAESVTVYDNEVPRPQRAGCTKSVEFSPDGNAIYGSTIYGCGYGFLRLAVNAQGVSMLDSTGELGGDTDLKQANGLIYGSTGRVLDPTIPLALGVNAATGPVAVDASLGRAYYLTQAGPNWELRAFQIGTFQPLGTNTVTGVQGTPGSLIRCGADRLAFRTSSGQLFVIHSQLASTNPLVPADLGVTQKASQDFAAMPETLRFLITVTNRGPGDASNVLLVIKPPSLVASVTIQLPQGTGTNSGGNYLCSLGSLPPGQSLDVVLSVVITDTSSYSNFVSVSAAVPDPDLTDNTSLATLQGLFFQRPDSTLIFPSSAQALAYDFVRQRLFASLAPSGTTNLIEWYDPQSGAPLGTMPVDLAADTMRVTDDGHYLYLSSRSAGLVERIDLSSLSLDLSFTPPQASKLWTMAIIPGSPHSIAVGYFTNVSDAAAVIYDDAVARTNAVIGQPFGMLVASTATDLYGYSNIGTGSPRVFRISVTASGLAEIDHGPLDTPWYSTSIMKYASNRLFFGSGDVLEMPSWNLEQPFTLPGGGPTGDLELLPGYGLAAFLAPDLNSYSIAHFGIYVIGSRNEIEQFDIHIPGGGCSSLTWCGADRFAFITSGGIVFVRSSSVPAADLSASASFSTNQVMAGDMATLHIVVSNSGPYAVSAVYVTNTLPNGFNLISAGLSQGSFTTNGQTVVCALGAMSTNTSATVNLTISLDNSLANLVTNVIVVTNVVSVVATDLPDPIPFNNSIASQLVVVPRDSNHDGIPDYWDLRYGFNTNDPAVASEDSTGDGISNLQKYLNGTDPFVFYGMSITGWRITGPSNFYLTVHAAVGMTYALETSTNLVQWSTASTFLCQSTNQQVQAPFDPASPMAFYRISTTTNRPTPILAMLKPAATATNAPVLQVAAQPGFWYTVYTSTNLVDWTVLTNYHATVWNTRITDFSANGDLVRFYRAETR